MEGFQIKLFWGYAIFPSSLCLHPKSLTASVSFICLRLRNFDERNISDIARSTLNNGQDHTFDSCWAKLGKLGFSFYEYWPLSVTEKIHLLFIYQAFISLRICYT